MLVGELALPAQVLKRPLQLLCQILKQSSLQRLVMVTAENLS